MPVIDRATRQHLADLARRLAVQSGLIRDLEARLGEHGDSLRTAWRKIEGLERERSIPASAGPIPAAAPALEARVPAAAAAEALGCSSSTVRRLVASGALRGDSRRLTGRRRHWSVSTADLERLIAKGGAPAAPGTPEPPIPGARRAHVKG